MGNGGLYPCSGASSGYLAVACCRMLCTRRNDLGRADGDFAGFRGGQYTAIVAGRTVHITTVKNTKFILVSPAIGGADRLYNSLFYRKNLGQESRNMDSGQGNDRKILCIFFIVVQVPDLA